MRNKCERKIGDDFSNNNIIFTELYTKVNK